tara:strand:- start:643 stop:798 length:156 start_codon:yes stop_codon:yes gene_type:complete
MILLEESIVSTVAFFIRIVLMMIYTVLYVRFKFIKALMMQINRKIMENKDF